MYRIKVDGFGNYDVEKRHMFFMWHRINTFDLNSLVQTEKIIDDDIKRNTIKIVKLVKV